MKTSVRGSSSQDILIFKLL